MAYGGVRKRWRLGALALALVWSVVGAVTVPGPARSAISGNRPMAGDVPSSRGYWLAASDGGVFGYGDAAFQGSMGGQPLNSPVVASASTPSGKGYWLAASDGGIFAFGDAGFYGSTGGMPLVSPIVGMAPTSSGRGYWLVAADGGMFAFGDARFFGSMAGRPLPAPVVGFAVTPGGTGYWMATSRGDVYGFGDAGAHGSAAGYRLVAPIVGMASAQGGKGYWLAAADGAVFSFGDAPFLGSMGGMPLNRPIVGMTATPRRTGYWLVASDGGIFAYGAAPFYGSTGGMPLNAPVVAMTSPPVLTRSEVSVFYYPWWAHPADGGGVWRHWEQGGHSPPLDVAADFYPTRGAYSSADAAIVEAQMAEISRADVDTIVSSWWGAGSYEDSVLPLVVSKATAHGMRVAIHIEPYAGRSAASVERDISRLRFRYGVDDFYIYLADMIPSGDWAGIMRRLNGVRVFGESGSVASMTSGRFAGFAAASGFDGVYTYNPVRFTLSEFGFACGAARQRGLLCSPSVAPGHTATRTIPGRTVIDRANGHRYNIQWLDATAAGGDVISITSYNEWHEGTQIEPARPYCWPQGGCSPGYEGAYGRSGPGATVAYMDATFAFSQRYRAARP